VVWKRTVSLAWGQQSNAGSFDEISREKDKKEENVFRE
jgi:hypothetical protein